MCFAGFRRLARKLENFIFGKPEEDVEVLIPEIFSEIRRYKGITEEHYAESFKGISVQHELQVKTANQAFLVRTANNDYILKGISYTEAQTIFKVIPDFLNHYARNPNSAIAGVVGFYQCETQYFIVMENVYQGLPNADQEYDIKGSSENKDRSEPTSKIPLTKEHKEGILQVLRADIEFLSQMNLMDYSVLIGIDELSSLVRFGIADTLTPYDWKKKSARCFKTKCICLTDIDTAPPEPYGNRLMNYMVNLIEVKPEEEALILLNMF